MLPTIRIGRRFVSTYRLLVHVSAAVFVVVVVGMAWRAGLPLLDMSTLAFGMTAAAIVAGRGVAVMTGIGPSAVASDEFAGRGASGASSLRAAAGAIVVGVGLTALLQLPVGATGDICVSAWVPAFMIARLACWCHGCCRGRASERCARPFGEWAGSHAGRFPFPLADGAAAAGAYMAVALFEGLANPPAPAGTRFICVCVIYLVARVSLGRWRADHGRRRLDFLGDRRPGLGRHAIDVTRVR